MPDLWRDAFILMESFEELAYVWGPLAFYWDKQFQIGHVTWQDIHPVNFLMDE
jgi:hypothetical protein